MNTIIYKPTIDKKQDMVIRNPSLDFTFKPIYVDSSYIRGYTPQIENPRIISEEQEIIEEPARKACLKWEVSDKGEGLNHLIANDAVAIHDLPLIEFALSELYEKRDADNTLTFRAYREIGGLEGAIAKYANGFYDKLSPKEQKALK